MHTLACLSEWIAVSNKGFNCVVMFPNVVSSASVSVTFSNGVRHQKSV